MENPPILMVFTRKLGDLIGYGQFIKNCLFERHWTGVTRNRWNRWYRYMSSKLLFLMLLAISNSNWPKHTQCNNYLAREDNRLPISTFKHWELSFREGTENASKKFETFKPSLGIQENHRRGGRLFCCSFPAGCFFHEKTDLFWPKLESSWPKWTSIDFFGTQQRCSFSPTKTYPRHPITFWEW